MLHTGGTGQGGCRWPHKVADEEKEVNMRNVKRNVGIVGAGAVIATLGLGGAMAAQASTTPAPSHTQVQKATEPASAETSDGANVGPDANANESGHQDANEKGEAANDKAETAGESESAKDDGPNVGPDTNPNEPGHQDADQPGDVAGN